MAHKKKLIEVALPLEAINKASAREKSIRHGHPSTLHLWWARRPLAAARAVLFAQMVDDPSSYPDLFTTEKAQEKERQRLFRIIEDLVQWENTNNEEVLQAARDEIWRSWRRTCAENADHPQAKELFDRHKLPAFHDPFAGGGSIPLEAQRLGLESYASDLNPVAVLINKAMIEIPPKFAGKPPVNPKSRADKKLIEREWHGAEGLAEDVRYYGQWLRDEAEKCIGHLYPKVEITEEMARERPDLKGLVGQKLMVIAWIWARTVRSPNPAFAGVDVPLSSTFWLTNKSGKEAYIEPIVVSGGYRFSVRVGKPDDLAATRTGTKISRGANFACIMSGTPITSEYIKAEGMAGRMGARLMAIVAEGEKGRVYLSTTIEHESIALKAQPSWAPEQEIAYDPHSGATYCVLYGLTKFSDLFTSRQLTTLACFSDLLEATREKAMQDAAIAGLNIGDLGLEAGGAGGTSYADAITTYLGFGIDKLSDRHSTLTRWDPTPTASGIINTFSRQALPMTWDHAEGNPFSDASGNFEGGIAWIVKVLNTCLTGGSNGAASNADACCQNLSRGKVISTDPPYYDNVPYADISEFFYVWLRRSLRTIYPSLFATVAVPKVEELVATASRHGSKEEAESFFVAGMTKALNRIAATAHTAFPVTIYYAFKQAESSVAGVTASTGWETFLEAVISARLAITGTWPIRTELGNRMRGLDCNALASSVVVVCRQCAVEAPIATRREFIAALKLELPNALQHLQRGNIAPVDLAQSAIGPGMAVFTRYSQVLESSGKPLSVREALALINQTLDEILTEQEGDFDPDTRWALAWFDQQGFSEGESGTAETLSKAKNTSITGLEKSGILQSHRGKVRLLKPGELLADWDPATDKRLTVWEMVHHLIRVLESDGESAAAELAGKLGSQAEAENVKGFETLRADYFM